MMKIVLKSAAIFVIIILFSVVLFAPQTCEGKKGKKSSLAPEDVEKLTASVNMLYKKVYSNSLFSPADNDELFEDKIKLDEQIEGESPDEAMAGLVYKMALIFKQREFKDDSIDYYRSLLDKFPDSAYVPKASAALKELGVKLEEASEESEE